MGQPLIQASQRKLETLITESHANTSGHGDAISVSSVSSTIPGTALLVLAKLRPAYWPWSWGRLAFSRWFPDQAPGLQFIKTLGSGRGGGFGLAPSAS